MSQIRPVKLRHHLAVSDFHQVPNFAQGQRKTNLCFNSLTCQKMVSVQRYSNPSSLNYFAQFHLYLVWILHSSIGGIDMYLLENPHCRMAWINWALNRFILFLWHCELHFNRVSSLWLTSIDAWIRVPAASIHVLLLLVKMRWVFVLFSFAMRVMFIPLGGRT